MSKGPTFKDGRPAHEAERLSPADKALANPKSMRAAINAKCHDCSGYSKPEVGRCVVTTCALWPLRPWQKVRPTTGDGGEDS